MTAPWLGLCTVVFLVLSTPVWSQANDDPPAFGRYDDIPEIVSFYSPLIVPKIIQDGYRLKDFICGEEFARLRHQYGDVYAVDAIFDRALRLSWNNVYQALLISFVATMDHRNFGVDLPVVGPILWFPLTSEFPDEFTARVDALPSRLYRDSPDTRAGDRDKLQHFFGSALVTYVFESRDAAERVGDFIEMGEERLIVDGALDERDFRANRQGQEFAVRLLEGRREGVVIMPSQFLRR